MATTTGDPVDPDAIEAKWLQQCGLCDAGLPYGCTHPDEDHRPVILSLVREVERLRTELDPDTHRDTEPWARRLFEQRDAALAEIERLRAHILDIAAHATPYGDIPDEPGWVGTYLLTAGALHRALGTIGHAAPSCQAEAERDEARAGRDRFRRLAAEMLSVFTEKGHPGRPCLRSGWVDETRVVDWHRTYRELS